MVLLFKSTAVQPPALIYMGKDKFENEELIKVPLGSDQDIWFHVDRLSSAHVYLAVFPADQPAVLPFLLEAENSDWSPLSSSSALQQLNQEQREKDDFFRCPDWQQQIPEALLTDISQLVKANSIEGNKKDNVTIIYTPWTNLRKTASMPTGQVSFQKEKTVKKVFIKTRENAIVNRLNKTKVEQLNINYQQIAVDRQRHLSNLQRAEQKQRIQQEREKQRRYREEKQLQSYSSVFSSAKSSTSATNHDLTSKYYNEETGDVDVQALEDDFM